MNGVLMQLHCDCGSEAELRCERDEARQIRDGYLWLHRGCPGVASATLHGEPPVDAYAWVDAKLAPICAAFDARGHAV